MEFLNVIFRAIDAFFMTITVGVATLLGTFNINFPPLAVYAPRSTSAITQPINTTVSVEATTTVSSTPQKATPTKQKTATAIAIATSPTKTATPATPQKTALDYETLNTRARAALVNILCLSQSGSGLGSVSGSGVIVDSRGIILTNAHIGQFFLLKDYPSTNNVECTIRTGAPASPKYHAELVYLPPAWVDANASQLKAEKPMGTGEHDYAFLRITGSTNPNEALPASFPALSLTLADPDIGEEVLLAAYPAGFLDGTSIERDLYPTSAFTVVQKLFTFDAQGFIDVVSIGGTVVSQGGSSGGGMIRGKDGTLMGIIATATAGTTTGDRDLRAVMASHINRSLTQQGKGSIAALLAQDPKEAAANFAANIAPSERKKLIDALNSN